MAVLLSAVAGLLATALLAVLVWGVLALAGAADAPVLGITAGVAGGLFLSGFAAGRLAGAAPAFHGSLAGLGSAAVVASISLLGGSPAPPVTLAVFVVTAALLGAGGGILGRRRP